MASNVPEHSESPFTLNDLNAFDGGALTVVTKSEGEILGVETIVGVGRDEDGFVRAIRVADECGAVATFVPASDRFEEVEWFERDAHELARGVTFTFHCVDDVE